MALTPYPSLATLPEVIANSGKVPNSYLNPSWISLKHDLGIPDDATITGVGSTSFTDAGYGTLTLSSGPYAGQTVTQAIQTALNLCASGPVGLLWDVRCSVGVQGIPGLSGNQLLAALTLRRPGNLHIMGRPGCGAILRAQCNSSIFSNELPTFGTPIANAGTDQQISSIGGINFANLLIENVYLNANSGVTTGSPSSPIPGPNQPSPTFGQIYYLNLMRLFGVQNVTFRNCSFVGAGGFHLYFGNWQNLLIQGCTIDSLANGGTVGGNDCIHLNGPGDQATIRDCLLAAEDDYIAINTADGSNASGRANGPSIPNWGSITRVRGSNLRSTRAASNGDFVRLMACGAIFNGGHEFDGLYGPVNGFSIISSSTSNGATNGVIDNVEFRNLDLDFSQHGAAVGFSGNQVTINRLNLTGVRRSGSNLANPLLAFTNSGSTIARLDIDDLRVYDDTTSGSVKQQVVAAGGNTITKFSARKVRLDSANSGQANMPLLAVNSGATVSLASLEDVTSDHVLDQIVNAGTLGTLLATRCEQTGAGAGAIIANTGSWASHAVAANDPATTLYTGTGPTT